jgi:biopolymer transport protein ExbD
MPGLYITRMELNTNNGGVIAMRIRNFLLVILACVSVSATAQVISLAYEVMLSDLRLPAYTTGTIGFKECDPCETHSVSVTADTQYFLNDVAMPLTEFAKEMNATAARNKTTATVMRHLESDTVITVHVYRK